MKNARIIFTKDGPARYISHLDLNRVMLRAVGKSKLDVWRTEGFNQHAYITFALPLSLGFSSDCESMDFRLVDDGEDMSAVPGRLNACLPEGIRVLSCAEAVHKPADIASASYDIRLEAMNDGEISEKEISDKLREFLALPGIIVTKKTKKGSKEVDLRDYIIECKPDESSAARLSLTLPAGGSLNINPSLFVTALDEFVGVRLYADIARTGIYTQSGKAFE